MAAVDMGLSNALGEITLVLFTTLAPAATFAYLLVLIAWAKQESDEKRRLLRKTLWIPLVLSMLGLVASATHLGNPANALYVFAGVGTSPLSNEVLAAVVFLASAAVFWLAGFSLAEHHKLDTVLAGVITLAGIAFIGAMAFAYHVDTIPTWNLPVSPVALAASAVAAGPLLALFVLHLGAPESHGSSFEKALLALSAAGSFLWVVAHAVLGTQLGTLSNSLVSASELVPCYWPALIIAAASLAAACVLAACSLRHADTRLVARVRTLAVVLSFAAVFIMRFMFYMLHMTVGVAV